MKSILIAHHDCEKYAKTLGPELEGFDVLLANGLSVAGEDLIGKAHVILATGPAFNEKIIGAARNVEWIQALTTGTDGITGCRNLAREVLITSTRGIHGPQMSELTLLLMLALTRRLPRMLANQAERKWERWPQSILDGKTVTILGVGAIAEHLAPLCKGFGLTVLGISQSPRQVAGFDRVYRRDELKEAVGQADYFVVIVPYSPETDKIVDGAVLAAMKPSAFFINVARGGVVDEAALIDTLRERRIAGAGLDVFETEPLPSDNPLWAMDNVIITPKVGGMTDVYVEQTAPIVRHNLRAYREGRLSDLVNVVANQAADQPLKEKQH
jgi:phosphoglycerate dehydrogenase-like enzyme